MSTETAQTTSSVSKDHVVCLVGMPNSGKTTLMNALTGGNFKSANYAGVTVSLLRGRSKPEYGAPRNVVDLPGVHSSVAPSPEEELAVEVIEGRHSRVKPDRSEEHTSELQSRGHLVCRLLLEKKKKNLNLNSPIHHNKHTKNTP